MTVDNFISQFDAGNISGHRDDVPGKILLQFNSPVDWDYLGAKVYQMIIMFDENNRHLKAFKLYGSFLDKASDYVSNNHYYMGTSIIHYMTDYNSFPETLLLLTTI